MTRKIASPGTSRGFYGWVALTGVVLVAFVVGGTVIYSYGVFLPIMCADFGWKRSVVSVGFTVGMLAFGLPGPLTGALIARFGARINVVLGSLLAALGLVGMSLAQEVWHVYLFYGLAGLGAGVGGFLTCSTVANNWFARKRSLAMGIYTAAAGLGTFTFPPLEAVLISAIGWRMTWLVLAGILFVVGSIIGGLILVRNRPEDMGQVPDGMPVEPREETVAASPLSGADETQEGWLTGQALRNPVFWIIAIFGVANYFAMGTMAGHQVAYIQDLGFSHMVAAMTMSMVPGVGIIGRLGFGVLALRFNIRKLAIACFSLQLIALVILLTTQELALIYVYAALFGISTGAILTALPTFIGAYYGRVHFAPIQGVAYALGLTAFAVGPTVAGFVYDAAFTYTPVFVIIIACCLVGLICAFMVRKPRLPRPDGR